MMIQGTAAAVRLTVARRPGSTSVEAKWALSCSACIEVRKRIESVVKLAVGNDWP